MSRLLVVVIGKNREKSVCSSFLKVEVHSLIFKSSNMNPLEHHSWEVLTLMTSAEICDMLDMLLLRKELYRGVLVPCSSIILWPSPESILILHSKWHENKLPQEMESNALFTQSSVLYT